jgi:hypothetical protein
MVLTPRPQIGGAFGGGGIMQRVRNAFQQVSQFPQQLHQLAHQANHYPSNVLQHALDTARMATQSLLSARPPMVLTPRPQVQMPHAQEPMVLIPRPPLQPAHEFSAGIRSFDAASLSQQLGQLRQQALQSLQENLALMRQSLQVLAADSQRLGAGAAAGAFPVPAKPPQA